MCEVGKIIPPPPVHTIFQYLPFELFILLLNAGLGSGGVVHIFIYVVCFKEASGKCFLSFQGGF